MLPDQSACLPKARKNKERVIPHAYTALPSAVMREEKR